MDFRLVPNGLQETAFPEDYDAMINSWMIYRKPPKFDTLLEVLASLEEELNRPTEKGIQLRRPSPCADCRMPGLAPENLIRSALSS